MRNPLTRAAVCFGLLLTVALCFSGSNHSFAQRRQPALVCKQQVLAALKPIPRLEYECGDLPNDWDKKILELPARRDAIKNLTSQLAGFTDAAWWTADTVDLNVCDFAQQPGALTTEQRHDFVNGEYLFWLFGNDPIRLVLIPDPCYQTQYGGSNAFLLYRNGAKVFVTQAVAKKLFRGATGLTNQISSALLLDGGADPLKIIRRNTLAPAFIIYRDNGSKPIRKVLRWNGNVYR
jgi:hypothetical protein